MTTEQVIAAVVLGGVILACTIAAVVNEVRWERERRARAWKLRVALARADHFARVLYDRYRDEATQRKPGRRA